MRDRPVEPANDAPAFFKRLLPLLVVGMVLRIGYLGFQPATDPAFARPILDANAYWEWAGRLAAGAGHPEGAFYLAPLYPTLLALFRLLAGESFATLYLLQHALGVAAAGILGVFAYRMRGRLAGLATAALLLLYHPAVFFASRPLGETLALLLLSAAVVLARTAAPWAALASGLTGGLAALARPNLILAPLLWSLEGVWRRHLARAGLIALGGALVLAPVACRNRLISGHWVTVSSNGGVTLFHGNAPGALGIYTPIPGFSGNVAEQREEARAIATRLSGAPLDAVAADRFWGRQAIAARLADPWGSGILFARKLLLTLDNYEHGLDYAPELDANPWRHVFFVPFAAILGLAIAGVLIAGWRGALGGTLAGAILATAVTPLVFYVSSRYRLPLAALLCVPAGIGVDGIVRLARGRARSSAWRPIAAATVAALVSLVVRFPDLTRAEEAVSLANRSGSHKVAMDLAAAEAAARAAIASDPTLEAGWLALGITLEAAGRIDEAESAYRRALDAQPASSAATGNLSSVLIRRGAAAEAVPLLRKALELDPGNATCWTNLVIALASVGDRASARTEARRAESMGVALEAGLLREVGAIEDSR